MRCEEIMKRDIECLSPNESAAEAGRQMREKNIGFLPVCQADKRVMGTVTDRDLAIRLVADDIPASTPVQDFMTREVISCRPEDDIRMAEELMAQNHKSRIMCTDADGRLVGILSLSDIAQHEQDGRSSQTLRRITQREARA
jgi:CBS domain-containing protein